MIQFSEEYECKADSKGRIMVPSSLRAKLAPVLKDGLVLKRSIFQKCLEVYTMAAWEKEMKQVGKLNRFVKKNNDFIRQFTAGVRVVEIDANGRLSLPKNLMAFAGIEKEVVLSESIDRIEVWDKQKYYNVLDEGAGSFSDLAEDVMGGFEVNNYEDGVS
ncbi:division/cell wall cluster transcriptional repressor MraZ [Galbibacter pacificus]|uniref:Transcriptional regulator MraZ n=1 Tax=Galbibacter pacificus TaxID=2996052 RepID=A0ABT6FMM3_9FLAO|nr:division/cell wall cluster transcriptional repressor MraZ [Galbibacter pacificus]MDG3581035.1 division/cell wall cluster transcriptional repressor MraZ [Galbibacter pacificus]MDG3584513.1 division/cell wall cluster transcriptional repressor MraZ [Galbibacter pacificus]